MFETVTVDEALARGKRTINYPVLVIMFGCIFLAFTLMPIFDLPLWTVTLGFATGFLLAWLWWSITIVQWRIWAFDNVRNVHDLKKRAIKQKLIWPDDSFFNKTEIWSAEQKLKWQDLQQKFKLGDVFHDDLTIGAETLIRYSKTKAGLWLASGLVLALFGLFGFDDKEWAKWAVVAFGLLLAAFGYRRLVNRSPQLILTNEGVTTSKGEHYRWSEITGEDTKVVSHGKSSTTYFIFYLNGAKESFQIDDYNISATKVDRLLRVYRGRHENKTRATERIF